MVNAGFVLDQHVVLCHQPNIYLIYLKLVSLFSSQKAGFQKCMAKIRLTSIWSAMVSGPNPTVQYLPGHNPTH